MDLKPAEELGYVSTPNGDQPPLVIPASAPLLTGTRAVVYVQLVDREEPTFEGRQIVLGPRAGDYYLVREDVPGGANLTEGELVVVNGNFKIDSSLQIQARTSMMNPPDRDESVTTKETVEDSIMPIARIAVTEDFLESLDPVYAGYLAIQAALADDDLLAFQTAAGEMHTQVDLVDDANLGDEPAQVWGDLSEALLTTRKHIQHVADLDAARSLFETYSNAMIELSSRFDYAGSESISIAYCFMAFGDKGASWLQTGDVIRNPYLGSVMPRCGEFKGAINTSAEPASQPASGGESVDE